MSLLSAAAVALIREHAGEAERRGELHPAVLALIYEEQWFRVMVPQRYGGLAWPLPAVVRLEEELARADGSVAWTVTLCSGAGWFAGFFPVYVLERVFSHPRMCIAGSGMAAGRAERLDDGGYRITGQWGYASGSRHATAFTANCVVWAHGSPVPGEDGQPLVRPFLFLRDEVQTLDDWKAVGLVATGSHGFTVSGLEVPPERCFVIDGAAAADASPLYSYPFLPLAEATLAVNSCGMAFHFLDCFEELFSARMAKGHLSEAAVHEVQQVLENGKKELRRVREEFYTVLDASWAGLTAGNARATAGKGVGAGAANPRELIENAGAFDVVSRVSHELAATVRQWVDRIYPFAGLAAAHIDSEINRVWRDLHTASQHPLLAFSL